MLVQGYINLPVDRAPSAYAAAFVNSVIVRIRKGHLRVFIQLPQQLAAEAKILGSDVPLAQVDVESQAALVLVVA